MSKKAIFDFFSFFSFLGRPGGPVVVIYFSFIIRGFLSICSRHDIH